MSLFAYLDPGTGSMVLQVIVGGLLGAIVLIRAYWSKILGLFGKNKSADNSSAKSNKTAE